MIKHKSTPDIFIIDNFYDDPEAVRNTALTCQYMPTKHDDNNFRLGNAPWPGKMSANSYSPKNLDLSISKLVGKPVRELKGINSGRFRISNANDITTNDVHIDTCSYAGVVYLNNVSNTPGTIFYTHKNTNRYSCDTMFFNELIVKNELNNLAFWDINLVSYIVFNRLIVYPANMFHGVGPLFGNDDASARLIQIFFWESL